MSEVLPHENQSGLSKKGASSEQSERGTNRTYLYPVLKKLLPILSWLPNYTADNLRADIPAGLTVGVMLIPQGMAYAMIAGLPVEFGLYAALVPQIIYALTGTSRQLAVGPVAMDSLLVAAGLSAIAATGSTDYISMAIVLALMMGCIQLALGILNAGFLVNFLSKPIISGFTSAAALIIASNQISNFSGIPIERNTRIQHLISEGIDAASQVNTTTVIIGLATAALILLASRVKTKIKIPTALITVVLGIAVVKLLNLDENGVEIVGAIPSGLPSFGAPNIKTSNITTLLPIAFTLALVAFMEAYSVSKSLAEKHDYKIDSNQELRAIGAANIIGSFFQSYPTTGGFSRTAVNEQAGASTPMSSIFASALIALTLLFLTPLFYHLPLAVLAAIIITAVMRLFDYTLPMQLWRSHKTEAFLLIATFATTLFIGMVEGITAGVLLSVSVLVFKQMRPHFTELGQIKGTSGVFRNTTRFPEAEVNPNLLIVRFDAPIHFANHRFFQDSIIELLNKRDSVKSIILCAESISYIDASGINALEQLIEDLEKRGIDFRLAAAIGPVRDAITQSKLISRIGVTKCFTSMKNAIEDFNNPGAISDNSNKIATQAEIE